MKRIIMVSLLILFGLASICLAQVEKWSKKADMPTERSNISSVVLNGKVIVAGGMLKDFSSASEVEEYDPKTDTWSRKGNMTTARDSIAVGVVNGKFYAISGIFGCDEPTPIVEEYDPTTGTWTRKADIPTARLLASACVVNGKIYVIGGAIGRGDQNCVWWAGISTVEEYDPATDKWAKKADMPTARECLSTCAVNGRIYAIGGFSYGIFSTVEEYDPATDTWAKRKDMPTKRCNFAASAVNGKIYAVGGEANTPTGFTSVLEEYDPVKDEWAKKADMPTARSKIACSAVNGKLYVIGGYNEKSPAISLVEEYDTGFPDMTTSVNAEGKMPLTWGEIKNRH